MVLKRLIGLMPPNESLFTTGAVAGARGELDVTYLGTAGFIFSNADRTVVIDPFVSRPSPLEMLTQRLQSAPSLVRKHIPHADDVLVGHAHYDHVLDAPALCLQTGARLIGSRATMMVGRAAGVPESQMFETSGREDIQSGRWTLRGLPSRHGKVAGRVPLPGDITEPPRWPPRFNELRHGLVFNWVVDTGSLRVVHIDSADFINEELRGVQADVVCLCAVGRRFRKNYVKDAVRLLNPRWVIACHWDTMMTHIEETPELIPTVNLPGFVEEIRAAGAEPLVMPVLGRLEFRKVARADAA